ncbi:MAG: hypothetical protein J6K41_02040 [Paraprevotella sp.]|nr:hypothetical protein [Paraprevotella sp.]
MDAWCKSRQKYGSLKRCGRKTGDRVRELWPQGSEVVAGEAGELRPPRHASAAGGAVGGLAGGTPLSRRRRG